MSERTPHEQYLICQERGHVPSRMRAMSNPPLDICKFCGTHYRVHVEERVIEARVPKPQ